ncbi:unnamed protein product [Caenorhabditis bovis]|uniref:Uncharacterized protein n=1 Tax=Caenorhabditis bovis TaxID=2654633 RepID=A0A8S1FCB4_9PELO|nr:unnamed protein product [Caenorhabditis bovis]
MTKEAPMSKKRETKATECVFTADKDDGNSSSSSGNSHSRKCAAAQFDDGEKIELTPMSLTTSHSAHFEPSTSRNSRAPISSTHSLATLNNNNSQLPPAPPPPSAANLEPLHETTPLTNGGTKLKKASVPVPDPTRRLRHPPTYSYPVSFVYKTLF